jgi:tRNA threonylcarbamoyladenosine biosynthesis protein TsaE
VEVSEVSGAKLAIISHSAEQTQRLGERLGELARAGDLFCLEGDLGSGKTCFVQGLGRGLKIPGAIHSPTFILANEHRGGRLPLAHLDVYRVRGADEAIGFGLEDYVNEDGVCVIEWAEKIREALPSDKLWITFQHLGESERGLAFQGIGERYEQLMNVFAPDASAITASPAMTSQVAGCDSADKSEQGSRDVARD